MAKKGHEGSKLIGKTSLGLTEEGNIRMRFDDFEIDMTPDRAASLAGRIFEKLGILKKKEALKNQQSLPLRESV